MQEILRPKGQFSVTFVAPSRHLCCHNSTLPDARWDAGQLLKRALEGAAFRALSRLDTGEHDGCQKVHRAAPHGLRAGDGALRRAACRRKEPLSTDKNFR